MWRPALLLAVFLSLPALAGSFRLLSFQPDGHGGATAFVLVSNKVMAVPIDTAGLPHHERSATLLNDTSEDRSFAIAPTNTGYLMTFSDPVRIAWARPLSDTFAATAPPRPFGRGWLIPLACHDDRCAAVHSDFDSNRPPPTLLVLMDAAGSTVAEVPFDPNFGSITATDQGGFAVLKTTNELEVTFINDAGQLTGRSVVATSTENFYDVAVVPHPLGVAVFWPDGPQVGAAIVRPDGAIVARAAFTAPDLAVASVKAAHGGGQYALEVTTVIDRGTFFPQNPNPRPPIVAANAMRVSESLNVLEGLVRLAPDAASSSAETIVASGDVFLALFTAPTYRLLRIPFTGPIDPSSSKPLNLVPPSRRRSVTP